MTIKLFGKSREVENLLIIVAYLLILAVIAVLVWKLISPILGIVIPIIVSYLFYLRKLLGRKK